MIKDKLISKTIYFSLVVQLITTFVGLHGFFLNVKKKDIILQDILGLETIVQVVEATFYIWIIFALKNLEKMTPRRYIDWFITTPTMLISTIMFMKYQEIKDKGELEESKLNYKNFFRDNKRNILIIVVLNIFMLLFGYLGEINYINKYLSIGVGFVFFFLNFYFIYEYYAKYSDLGKKLFYFNLIIWSLYGIAAMTDIKTKNISYNLLDIVAKNFYGIYIYYKILELTYFNKE